MMFKPKELSDMRARPFQIVIGLREGYNSGAIHSDSEVMILIGEWMKARIDCGLPCLTGGAIIPVDMIYAWNMSEGAEYKIEESVIFAGNVNPLYCSEMTDVQAVEALHALAAHIGTKLNQVRMYVTYGDAIWILEDDRKTHPTKK